MAIDYTRPLPFAAWQYLDPIVPAGVTAQLADGNSKTGDGVRSWSSLPWAERDAWDPTPAQPAPVAGATSPRSGVVAWGDSHLSNAGGDGEQSNATAPTVRTRGALSWALASLHGRGVAVHNAGKGGERTDQTLARYAADVRPYMPGVVVMNGGVNNVLQSVTSTPGTIAETVTAVTGDLAAMIAAVRADGGAPVLCTLPPFTMTENQLAAWAQINRWIRALPANLAGVTVVDWTRRVGDPAAPGTWAAGLSYDGTHASTIGAARMSIELAAALDRLLPVMDVSPSTTDPLDLAGNGLMLGSAGFKGGGVTGDVADGWTVAADGGSTTTVCTKVARGDGAPGEWQQFTVSAGTGVRCYADLVDGAWSPGDRLEATWEFETDDDLTVASLTDFYALVSTQGSFALAHSIKNVEGDSMNDPACHLASGVFRTWPMVVPLTGTTGVRVEFHMLGATGTFRLGRVAVNKV